MDVARRKMMKKFMSILLVLAMASVASAALVTINPFPEGEPGSATNPLRESDIIVIGVYSEVQLLTLDVILDASGPGSFTDAMGIHDAASYGWDPDTSFDAILSPKSVEIGGANFAVQPSGLVGYVLLHCDGEGTTGGIVTLTLRGGQSFGGTYDLSGPFTDIGGTITVHQIPEPMTVALLGLGGLALLRRRK